MSQRCRLVLKDGVGPDFPESLVDSPLLNGLNQRTPDSPLSSVGLDEPAFEERCGSCRRTGDIGSQRNLGKAHRGISLECEQHQRYRWSSRIEEGLDLTTKF